MLIHLIIIIKNQIVIHLILIDFVFTFIQYSLLLFNSNIILIKFNYIIYYIENCNDLNIVIPIENVFDFSMLINLFLFINSGDINTFYYFIYYFTL